MAQVHRAHRPHLGLFIGLAAGLVLGGAAAAVLVTRPSGGPASPPTTRPAHRVTEHPGSRPGSAGKLRVVAFSPAPGSSSAAGSAPIRLRLSTALSSSSPDPRVSPSTPGAWRVQGRVLEFMPSVPFLPLAKVRVVVPAGPGGLKGAGGETLAKHFVAAYQVRQGSLLRLQQLLSLLRYSPLAWSAKGTAASATDAARQARELFFPPKGSFSWRQSGWPTQLHSLFHPGAYDTMTRGLVMSFEADHGLSVDGSLSEALWGSLLRVLSAGELNRGGYNFALCSKSPPETLTIWHDGRVVLRTAANTGIPQSPTPDGLFPVYARYRRQVMKGTNPDGSRYADPVQFVAYFHDGDAVHYLARADYGIPQSLGCIELSLPSAERAWPWLAYGTLVDVVS